LVRQGLRPALHIQKKNGVPVFILPEDSPIITLEHTLALEDDLD